MLLVICTSLWHRWGNATESIQVTTKFDLFLWKNLHLQFPHWKMTKRVVYLLRRNYHWSLKQCCRCNRDKWNRTCWKCNGIDHSQLSRLFDYDSIYIRFSGICHYLTRPIFCTMLFFLSFEWTLFSDKRARVPT